MNNIKKCLLAAIYTVALISCNKYLDVQPKDRLLDQQVFNSQSSVQKALNGIYINIVSDNLYGGQLTVSTIDVMAQYYNIPTQNRFIAASTYKFLDGSFLQSDISTIWGQAYSTVLNINEFIQGVSGIQQTIFKEDEKKLLLGEAYGLRAFILFDMLRLFGPVYSNDSSAANIPYPTLPITKLSPLIPANQFMDTVIKDLNTAGSLLINDPIIQSGVQPFDNTDMAGNFFRARNRRMNYYAVKSLLARVYLYRGDKVSALKNAQEVISIAPATFPWAKESVSRAAITNPDRIFSSEIIFGPENTSRDVMYNRYFAASNYQAHDDQSIATLLAPLNENLVTTFEGLENDYRLRSSWVIDPKANYNFKTFTKYAPLTTNGAGLYPAYRNIQPLIRLSELYYIAAECTGNPTYLNTVRMNRGLLNPVAASGDITGEIAKEYKKEFCGEGQLFFYYKRKNVTTINNGSAAGRSLPMGRSQYILPVPLSETQYR